MFGLYRTMLAIWVMIFHLVSVPVIGKYAVFSFFILSGFLMTTIMHSSYGYGVSGVKRFAINRFLRLYPIYWAIAVLSVITLVITSYAYAINYKDALSVPVVTSDFIANITMVFPSLFPWDIKPRLSPPTWAITIELFYYICIAFGISKNLKRTLLWVFASGMYYAISIILGLNEGYRYGFLLAPSLPFSLGALLFFYKLEVFTFIKKLRISSPITMVCIYIANAMFFTLNSYYLPFSFSEYLGGIGKYFNIVLSLFVVASLFYRGEDFLSKRFDKIIGDYSYPIYLGHWQAGLLASFLLYSSPSTDLSVESVHVFLVALIIISVVSYILINTVDKNISLIRNRFKRQRDSEN